MGKILFREDDRCFICDSITFVLAWMFAIGCCIITIDTQQIQLMKEDLKEMIKK